MNKTNISRISKWIETSSLILAILAIFPSFISGAGILVSLVALILSGISFLFRKTKLALWTVVIVTMNLVFVSVLTDIQNISTNMIIYIEIPYGFLFLCVINERYFNRTKTTKSCILKKLW